MLCFHCSKEFKSKYSLSYHKNNPSQKCLKTRTEQLNFCNYCNSNTDNITTHILTCNIYLHQKIVELENVAKKSEQDILNIAKKSEQDILNVELINDELKSKLFLTELELKDTKKQHDKSKIEFDKIILEKNVEIKCIRESLIKEQSRYDKVATKSTTTTNSITYTNTINQYLSGVGSLEMTEEAMRSLFDDYTEQHFQAGAGGLATFAVDKLLKDDNGNKNYVVSDVSRYIFKHKSDDGIKRDLKAYNLLNVAVPLALERAPLFFDATTEYDYGEPDTGEDYKEYLRRHVNTIAYNSLRKARNNPKKFCKVLCNKLLDN